MTKYTIGDSEEYWPCDEFFPTREAAIAAWEMLDGLVPGDTYVTGRAEEVNPYPDIRSMGSDIVDVIKEQVCEDCGGDAVENYAPDDDDIEDLSARIAACVKDWAKVKRSRQCIWHQIEDIEHHVVPAKENA